MKLKNILLSVIAVAMVLGFFSCKTSSVPIQILVPAEINIPKHINSVVIANRSLPSENKDKILNILEGLFTGESILADRYGGENCIQGLNDKLNQGPRFQAYVINNSELRGTGTKEFAPPLAWYEVNKICNQYKADALVLLETFDTDIILNKEKKIEKRKKDDVEYEVPVYYSNLEMRVNAGWRIYDNKNQIIIDQNVYRDSKRWRVKGDTEDESMKRLPPKRDAINQSGYYAGQRFAVRISPNWLNTSRIYFSGKYDEFKRAKRYVQHDDWDEAIDIWKLMTSDPDTKIAGRACFNMGIAAEMKGQLESALSWMKKAYYDYNVKQANRYIGIYKQRIEDQKRLDEQMSD